MAVASRTLNLGAVPSGYRALPIHPKHPGTPLNVCVVARTARDPILGWFVPLREHLDASVVLGCIIDQAQTVREWVELWVQSVGGVAASFQSGREWLTNASLDHRWTMTAEALAQLDPQGTLQTGFESIHPSPTFLDPNTGSVAIPEGWELCTDDQVLVNASLPTYSQSLHRYLWQRASTPPRFTAITPGAPSNSNTLPIADAMGSQMHLIPWNSGAGLIRVGRLAPLRFTEYLDVLGGKPWPGLMAGKVRFSLGNLYDDLADWENFRQRGTHLFQGAQGRAACFTECLHLKLIAWRGALQAVHTTVAQHQVPLLNLSAESFRVRLTELGTGLPHLWTASVQLARPGEAVALPISTSDARYFVRVATQPSLSIYQPAEVGTGIRSSAAVRIRQVLSETQGTVVEGTMVLNAEATFSPRDLFWVRVPLPNAPLDLYGHLYAADGRASGEVRFRTVPLNLSAEIRTSLKSAEGVPFSQVPFESLPLLSSACDLYSLGVLGVLTLLCADISTLAVTLDELWSLAKRTADSTSTASTLGARIAEVLKLDAKTRETLGPQRLFQSNPPIPPDQTLKWVTLELWSDLLALLIRIFPGVHPTSFRRDRADAPALALEAVFEAPLTELDALVRRSRSLLVLDWHANREIAEVLEEFQARV